MAQQTVHDSRLTSLDDEASWPRCREHDPEIAQLSTWPDRQGGVTRPDRRRVHDAAGLVAYGS